MDEFAKHFVLELDYYFGMRLKQEEQHLADATQAIAFFA